MAEVKLKNITKRFGSVIAVNNVSLNVKDGEFMVLLGPSGCGKTTTLRLIAGLEMPDEGEIYIGNELVNELPPKDRDVAMVFQSYALYPHMKVYDNIAFPLKLRGMSKEEIDRRVKEVAKMLRISELLDRKPAQLSGGQQQRVALARAIIREPKVFLMDEPLSNLDAKLRVYMRAELKRLQKELKVTTIYVTHDQLEAMTMADRIAVMNEGRIQQVGEPGEIYEHPQNLFVAGFIGSPPMNFIEGSVKVSEDRCFVDLGVAEVPVHRHIANKVLERGVNEVIVGIRPENIDIVEKPIEGRINIRTEVYVVEPMGPEWLIDFKIADKIFKVKAKEARFRVGDKVYISFRMDDVYIFDKKTQKLIE